MGERKLAREIITGLPDVRKDPARFLGKTTLVVGSGYSAITFIAHLREAAVREAAVREAAVREAAATAAGGEGAPATTRVVWVTRREGLKEGGRDLYARVEGDPLPQRDALAQLANELANEQGSGRATLQGLVVDHKGASAVRRLRKKGAGTSAGESAGFEVTVAPAAQSSADESGEVVECNEIVAAVGYRPDSSIFQELHVHQVRFAAAFFALKSWK